MISCLPSGAELESHTIGTLHNFKEPKCHAACVGVCCGCDVPTPLLLFFSLIQLEFCFFLKRPSGAFQGICWIVPVQTEGPSSSAWLRRPTRAAASPRWLKALNVERWRGVCILVSAPVLCRRGAIAACPSMTPEAVGQSSVLC